MNKRPFSGFLSFSSPSFASTSAKLFADRFDRVAVFLNNDFFEEGLDISLTRSYYINEGNDYVGARRLCGGPGDKCVAEAAHGEEGLYA